MQHRAKLSSTNRVAVRYVDNGAIATNVRGDGVGVEGTRASRLLEFQQYREPPKSGKQASRRKSCQMSHASLARQRSLMNVVGSSRPGSVNLYDYLFVGE